MRFDPSQGDRTVSEGNSGTTSFVYPVILSAPSGKTVAVGITRTGAATPGQDFVFGTGDIPVTFTPGETSKDLHVIVNGDLMKETDELVVMQLQTAGNATNTNDNQVRVHTIKDDD